ncbi:hypothetical protein Btru_012554 [Bulinus truncatus]|nr:hypothetical protein Btru_012554 [Bulinus truncatus]
MCIIPLLSHIRGSGNVIIPLLSHIRGSGNVIIPLPESHQRRDISLEACDKGNMSWHMMGINTMLTLTLLAVVIAVATCSSEANWAVFKAKHNKVYSGFEDVMRRKIWETNLMKIEQHNELYAKGLSSYFLGENKYADMSHSEFVKTMNGLRVPKDDISHNISHEFNTEGLPGSIDWRSQGYVTDVKDQGQCGSCWAFSAIGSLEGQHYKATQNLVSLSESNLVDCSSKWGNDGCNGGWMTQAFQYVIDNKGIDSEACYPYEAVKRTCSFSTSCIGATISSFKTVPVSESSLQVAVATVGPVSVAIDASNDSFQHYSGGVYDEEDCSSYVLDHGVLVVGYGSMSGNDYWIVKNSWGTSWGKSGYIFMSRNKGNQCGIASKASYPVV